MCEVASVTIPHLFKQSCCPTSTNKKHSLDSSRIYANLTLTIFRLELKELQKKSLEEFFKESPEKSEFRLKVL